METAETGKRLGGLERDLVVFKCERVMHALGPERGKGNQGERRDDGERPKDVPEDDARELDTQAKQQEGLKSSHRVESDTGAKQLNALKPAPGAKSADGPYRDECEAVRGGVRYHLGPLELRSVFSVGLNQQHPGL